MLHPHSLPQPGKRTLARWLAVALLPLAATAAAAAEIKTEALDGKGVWLDPRLESLNPKSRIRATVWFEQQLLGDGAAYLRRSREFDTLGRTELRELTIRALKSAAESSREKARPKLENIDDISNLEFHWIVNGFSCTTNRDGIDALKKVPGVRKIFLAGRNRSGSPLPPDSPAWKNSSETGPFDPASGNPLWYIEKLHADRVWKELGVTGNGVLNVVHDSNFILSDWISGTLYQNPADPINGRDDDNNGLIDDTHGFNFTHNDRQLTTRMLPKTGRLGPALHGHQCVGIICGRAGDKRPVQPGLAPDSRWAGVTASRRIESAVEWAVEHGADTYSMSFSSPGLGDYRSHWRKVMEHGSFCGVHFVSGAGNFAKTAKVPVQMRIPEDIPHAVFAAAGVQRDLSRTPFSSQGPVEWNTEHYHDGQVDKPEVCAFNYQVPMLLPTGGQPTQTVNGNSFAGPMYCGTIALVLSANPELKPWETRRIIIETATDVAAEGYDFQTGHGLINIYEAVKRAQATRKDR